MHTQEKTANTRQRTQKQDLPGEQRRKTDLFMTPRHSFRGDFGTAEESARTAPAGDLAPVRAAETLTDAPLQAKKVDPKETADFRAPRAGENDFGGDAATYFLQHKYSNNRAPDHAYTAHVSNLFSQAAAPNMPAGVTQRGDIAGPDGMRINGLSLDRIPSNLSAQGFGSELSDEQISEMASNLTADHKYVNMSAEQKKNVSPEELAGLQDRFDTGFLALKESYYQQLLRLRERYGLYGTQMHPEDFLEKAGPQYFDDIAIIQDVAQMVAGGGKYFDYQHSKEDREFRDLTNYYFDVNNQISNYLTFQGFALDPEHAGMPDRQQSAMENMDFVSSSLNSSYERKSGGRGFGFFEKRRYKKNLQQRFAQSGRQDRLFGRFR